MCSVCETESTDDSKFCRKCGAPLTSGSAELEVLRISAEARSAKSSVVFSSIITPISAIAVFIFFLIFNAGMMKTKLIPTIIMFCGLGLLSGFTSSFFPVNRLKRALEKPETPEPRMPRHFPEARENVSHKELPSLDTGEFPALAPHQKPASITEGTTNLLDSDWVDPREKENVRVSKNRNTNIFE